MVNGAASYSELYPWYAAIEGDDLEQGDIIETCPVFAITLPSGDLHATALEAHFDTLERGVIIMTQSCDLVKDHPKVTEVLLCPVWHLDEVGEENKYFRQPKGREEIRRGNIPGYHMLNASNLSGFERPYRIVDFHRVFSLPLDFLRNLAQTRGPRLRLLPPYREHLGQAFARYFMRVGLPVDIPPSKK
jgi:hypothetical protein